MDTDETLLGRRALAYIIDSIIVGVSGLVTSGIPVPEPIGPVVMILWLLGSLVYVFLLEGIYGYTPGKYLLGLVVVKRDGSNCTIGASIIRNLLLIIDQLPFAFLIGIGAILITDNHQRVGDLAADTVVVRQA